MADGALTELRRIIDQDDPATTIPLLQDFIHHNPDSRQAIAGLDLANNTILRHPEVLRVLLDNSADINPSCPPTSTPLQHATEHQHWQSTQLLLERNAEVNTRRYARMRLPLHNAALHGHLETCAELVRRGADINAMAQTGTWCGTECDSYTPLMLALGTNQLECARLLISLNADINSRHVCSLSLSLS